MSFENRIRQMDNKAKLTKALASGAVTMLRPNSFKGNGSRQPQEVAYLKLKEMIGRRYGQVNEDLLDISPGSAERQEALANQLETAGAVEDEAILQQAEALLEILYEEDPDALWASAVPEPPSHLK